VLSSLAAARSTCAQARRHRLLRHSCGARRAGGRHCQALAGHCSAHGQSLLLGALACFAARICFQQLLDSK